MSESPEEGRSPGGKNPFFLPAAYRFNVTVLYSFEPPDEDRGNVMHSNTTPTTINIRSSLWAVMAGSISGGVLGASARILQQAASVDAIFTFEAVPPLLLAVVLSIAAAIFAARKSETQSFVSVEDFWGGALVGFLIGYSGTAAFEGITRIQT
jgi:ABC-type antimicrobial peptide transport system permease subunit